MKTFAVRLLMILCLLSLFIVGVDWIIETSGVTHVFWLVDVTRWPGLRNLGDEWLSFGVGAAFVALPALAALAWLLLGSDDAIEARSREGDLIRLRPRAIERALNREVRANVVDVINVSSAARQGKRQGAAVTVRVSVSDRLAVPQVERQVRDESVRVLTHMMGVADSTQVRVVVYDVQGAAAPRKRRLREAPAKAARKAKPAARKPEPAPADTGIE